MAKLVLPKDWLDHHSGRLAQEHAVRLTCCCSATLPTDKALQGLVEEQMKADLVGLAFHGRRLMERHNLKSATITVDTLWPSSLVAQPTHNLWDSFGLLIHASEVSIGWEKADVQPNPYKGREPIFAGHAKVTSDKAVAVLPIGGMVSSFFGQVLRALPMQ